MRSFCLAAVSMIALALPAVASAEPALKASRTAEQIVCELTGECGAVKLDDSRRLDKPEEAGFSLARPGASAPAPVSVRMPARPAAPVRIAAQSAQRPAAVRKGLDMRISFALGSAEMTPQSRLEAQAFARALTMPALAGARFIVAGHTDAIGRHEDNVQLSQARAEAVANYLKTLGVDSGRLTAKGFGPDSPLPGVSKLAGVNRRVEIVPDTVSVASAGL